MTVEIPADSLTVKRGVEVGSAVVVLAVCAMLSRRVSATVEMPADSPTKRELLPVDSPATSALTAVLRAHASLSSAASATVDLPASSPMTVATPLLPVPSPTSVVEDALVPAPSPPACATPSSAVSATVGTPANSLTRREVPPALAAPPAVCATPSRRVSATVGTPAVSPMRAATCLQARIPLAPEPEGRASISNVESAAAAMPAASHTSWIV